LKQGGSVKGEGMKRMGVVMKTRAMEINAEQYFYAYLL